METRATAATDDTTIAAIGNRRPGRWLGSWSMPPATSAPPRCCAPASTARAYRRTTASSSATTAPTATTGRATTSPATAAGKTSSLTRRGRPRGRIAAKQSGRCEMAESWRVEGDWFDVCRCRVPCGCTFAQDPRQCGTPSILGSASLGAGLTRFCRCASVACHVNASTGSSAVEPGDGRPSPR